VETVELASLARQLMKERCDEWVQQLSGEKCKEVSAAILSLLADWYGTGQRVGNNAQTQLLELTKKSLKCQGHQVIHYWNEKKWLAMGLEIENFNFYTHLTKLPIVYR
jgi:hypothetical protein